jgi:hypothetical protein
MLRAYSWDEIQEEREDEKGVDKRDDPFENSGRVPLLALVFNTKSFGMLVRGFMAANNRSTYQLLVQVQR